MYHIRTETFSIRFDAKDPECAFETEAAIDGIRKLHLLSGSTLVTRRMDDDGALCLWDLTDLRQEKLQLLNPSLIQVSLPWRARASLTHMPQPDNRVQTIYLAHDYALVVRMQTIEIYTTTPRPSLLSVCGPPIAYPLAQFKFQWRTDTVIMCEQHASPSPSSHPAPRPIHLFVRFGSIYPWPVNVLHHYLLLPNPTYHTGGGRAHSRGVSTSIPASIRRSSPTTEYNLPYDPHPYPTHTIGSPVRLFGQSAMTLGRYGTALWLDNHTEEWLGPSEHGQRLAGKVVQLEGGGASMVGVNVGAGGRGMAKATTPAIGAEPTVTANSSGASMVFGMRNNDAWTRIAMEEEAGRIALGHTDGAITLLEY